MIDPMMVTSNGLPGYRIDAVVGEGFASTIRPGAGSGLLRGISGGDEAGQLRLAHESRQHVLNELHEAMQRAGGNAVIGLRFDSCALGNGSEVCAYGTAVRIVPLGEGEPGATTQSIADANGQGGPATPQQTWPTMGGMGNTPYETGERPGATSRAEAPSAPRTPSAEPRPAPQPPHRNEAPESAQPEPRQQVSQGGEQHDDQRPRSPEQQRPNQDGSWLDL